MVRPASRIHELQPHQPNHFDHYIYLLVVVTFLPEKSNQKPRPSKNSPAHSSAILAPGLLARLFVFQINFFSKINAVCDLFITEIVIRSLGQF